MKYTKESIVLAKNEIIVCSKDRRNMVASTDKFYKGVLHLPRNLFVKPVDVEALAEDSFCNDPFDYTRTDYTVGFKAGYAAAPKKEFTREEALALFNEGCRQGTGNYATKSFDDCVAVLQPLSIPEYVIIEDNQVKEIRW